MVGKHLPVYEKEASLENRGKVPSAPEGNITSQKREICEFKQLMWRAADNWSRREDSNAPSTEYNSVALPLSYTGLFERIKITLLT